MTVARTHIAALLALALVFAAPAAAKQGRVKLRYPAAGQASLAQLTFKGKPVKPKLKGKLPADVGFVAGSRKLKQGRWAQSVVVFRRRAAARAHAADITFVFEGKQVTIDVGKPPQRTQFFPSFLPGGVPLPRAACNTAPTSNLTGRGLLPGSKSKLIIDSLFQAGCGHATDTAPQTFLCANGLLGCTNTGGGDGGTTPPAWTLTAGPTFTPDAGATDILGRDVNGDGFPDLVVGGSGGIELFPGGASNSIGAPTHVDTSHPWDFVGFGDFNGDGKGDLLGVSSSAGIVQSFLGNGSGAYAPGAPFTFSSGAPLRGLAIGNLNGDARADLVVGQNDGQAAILIGQASGGFVGNDFPVGNGGALFALGVADFNADGSPDLVVVGAGSTPFVGTLINHNDGTFGTPTPSNLLGAPLGLTTGDLNGDGKQDAGVIQGNTIQLFPGAGDGTFGTPTNLSFTGGVRVTSGDVNGDGFQDIIGLNRDGGSVGTFLGSSGALPGGSPITASVGASPVALSLLNFNGDGKPDIAVVGSGPSGGIFLGGP